MSDRANIRVLVADGHPVLRNALRSVMVAEPDMLVVAHSGDAGRAVRDTEHLAPDVAVLDADLPGGSGVGACAEIKTRNLPTRVIVLGEEADRRVLLAAIEAGADGYVTKAAGLDALLDAVRRVGSGEACIPPGMLGVLLGDLIRRRREEDAVVERFSRLSRREKEVFALLVEGCDNQDIATSLNVSANTARTHIQNVLGKLEVHSRMEAAALDVSHHLVERLAPQRRGPG